ncbi:MAG: GAF domain-containing protein [Gammaproteobacteria bacterium]|nr:GAF domain-containing protein [Gammaproteobacteria bacterium]
MLKLSIRYKIWLSFLFLVALLLAVGYIANDSLKANKEKLSTLVNDVTPAVVLSLNIVDELDHASSSLGFYLLSKEELHKKDYLKYMGRITESMATLRQMNVVKRDATTTALVAQVNAEVEKLQGYKDRMMLYASSDVENMRATKFAANEVNPRVQVLLQALGEMIASEKDQKSDPVRKQLLFDIYGLRTNLSSAVNELRLYLAFRVQSNISNFHNYVELVERDVKKLNSYGEDVLTFEQADALNTFNKVYKEYFPKAEILMKIHGAEDYRLDAYTIRKEISPLLLSIQKHLSTLVKEQQETSVAESTALTEQVKKTQVKVAGLIGVGLFCALLIGVLLSRAITIPIQKLRSSAKELAHGNLDQEIDTQRRDELGSLARSFADMRDSIKKKMENLRVLNVTGEIMASMHEPLQVLERALMVMRGHTNIEWGSVYLYNKETELLEVKTFHPTRYDQDAGAARGFKLGEGIAGKAAADKHVIYIPDTSKDSNYAAKPGDKHLPRSIICVPMVDNDEVFGVMNFSGKVGAVKFEESDIEFSETISRMAVVSFKNIHMLNVIEEQNRTLEHKVEERTAQLKQKTNDINNMLQNMHQGIFTIVMGGKVHAEYSRYLETILESHQIADADVMNLLFTNTNLGSNAVNQVQAALAAILGEDAMMFDFNRHCLVKEFIKTMPNAKAKILELDWDPITSENGTIDKLMVTVRDVTELRGLQAEAEKQKWELEIIGQILAVSANKFLAFTKDANRFIQENEALIKQTQQSDTEAVATLFRNMHTIKGNARTYGFGSITDAAHEAESTYDTMRKDSSLAWDTDTMLHELYQTRELVQTYEMIYKEKLSGGSSDGVFVDKLLVDKLRVSLDKVDDHNIEKLRATVATVRNVLTAIGTESISSVLDAIVKSMPEIAQRLGKTAPNIIIKDNDVRLTAEAIPVIKNVFTHGFRNAIDHGLEPPAERKASGKPEQGTITLEVKQNDQGGIVLRLSDDGRGLAMKKLKHKAVEKGLFKNVDEVNDEQLAELIFMSGVSTADSVSDVSGRGVGMDAIRKFVEKLGGKVEIHFKAKSGNSDFLPFESWIIIPADLTVKVA